MANYLTYWKPKNADWKDSYFIKKSDSPSSFVDHLPSGQIEDRIRSGEIQGEWLITKNTTGKSFSRFVRDYPSAQWLRIEQLVDNKARGDAQKPFFVPPGAIGSESPPPNPIVAFGWFLLLGGFVCAAYFLLFYDTSVAVPSEYISGLGRIGGGAVHNLGLMQNRTLGCIVGVGAAVVGALMVLLGRQKV